MKYAIVIPDGCADWPIESIGNKTPLQVAETPNFDALAASGIVGRSFNVPPTLSPGSDVATLSLLGYDPVACYTGRAPLEAVAQGIELTENDWAFRCNLVTIADRSIMQSFTAGHITTEEAVELLDSLQQTVAPLFFDSIKFYSGVSYRNLMIYSGKPGDSSSFDGLQTFPPHDFTDQAVALCLPCGPGYELIVEIMVESAKVFENHPVNKRRIAQGKLPATQCWLWGQGKKPQIAHFADRFAVKSGKPIKGAMITAVDLLRGIAKSIGWDILNVPGITGYVDTDYAAKGRYAADALRNYDLVCVHVEAPDEAGHEGSLEKKIKSLEEIDAKVVAPIVSELKKHGDWRILISPDHPTPIAHKTHTRDEVPWIVAGNDIEPGGRKFDESSAAASTHCFDPGWKLMPWLLDVFST